LNTKINNAPNLETTTKEQDKDIFNGLSDSKINENTTKIIDEDSFEMDSPKQLVHDKRRLNGIEMDSIDDLKKLSVNSGNDR